MATKKTHMGHQGKAVSVAPSHFKNKPTGKTPHPAGKKSSKAVSKAFNHG